LPWRRLRTTRPTKARLAVVAVAAAAVGVALVDGGDPPASAADDRVRLDFVYSTDMKALVGPLIDRFNARGAEVDGHHIVVRRAPINSGEAEGRIAEGDLEPVVWVPASTLWGRLLDAHVGRSWIPRDTPSLLLSPQVIAIPRQQAKKLGWPERPIRWKDIPSLVADGRLRFAHPSALSSTSGLSAVVAEYYAVTGKVAGLTLEDVRDAREEVRKMEQSVVHYARTADDFLDQLARYGPSDAPAIVVQEMSLVNKNEEIPWRVDAVYPADGTFIAEYPYIVMNAPWVSAREREAARVFLEWLRAEITPGVAARHAFRLPNAPVLPPVDREHGADADEPDAVLRTPPADVLTAIVAAWKADRKRASIVLAVDESVAAEGGGRDIRRAVDRLLRPLTRQHRVGLVVFGDQTSTVVPVGAVGANGDAVRNGSAGVAPGGEAALYDAIAEGVRQASDAKNAALVVVTDGRDEGSSIDLEALTERVRDSGVRVFTVAYGDRADRKALAAIAAASKGKASTADPGELPDALHDIAFFF
jgi:Ca-activated chloride channel family protein